jgi:hypothetical protein
MVNNKTLPLLMSTPLLKVIQAFQCSVVGTHKATNRLVYLPFFRVPKNTQDLPISPQIKCLRQSMILIDYNLARLAVVAAIT